METGQSQHWQGLRVTDLLYVTLFVAFSVAIIHRGTELWVFLPAAVGVLLPHRLGYGPAVIGLSVCLAYVTAIFAITQLSD